MQTKMNKRKMSLFHILMEHAHNVYTDGLPEPPQEFIDEKDETMEMNRNKIEEWIDENIDFKGSVGFRVSKKEIKLAYEESGEKVGATFDKQIRDILKRRKIKYDKNNKKDGCRGIYMDIKLIEKTSQPLPHPLCKK